MSNNNEETRLGDEAIRYLSFDIPIAGANGLIAGERREIEVRIPANASAFRLAQESVFRTTAPPSGTGADLAGSSYPPNLGTMAPRRLPDVSPNANARAFAQDPIQVNFPPPRRRAIGPGNGTVTQHPIRLGTTSSLNPGQNRVAVGSSSSLAAEIKAAWRPPPLYQSGGWPTRRRLTYNGYNANNLLPPGPPPPTFRPGANLAPVQTQSLDGSPVRRAPLGMGNIFDGTIIFLFCNR